MNQKEILEAHRRAVTNKYAWQRFKPRLLSDSNGFKEHKHLYENQLIPYDEAPTGKAFIGVNKQPLQKNETGHGFKGVLLQDEDRELVQCHNCGKWLQHITGSHTRHCSGIDQSEYKRQNGLNSTQPLISDALALEKSDFMYDNYDIMKVHQFKKGVSPSPGSKQKRRIQAQNLFGTCEKQLGHALAEFIRRNHSLPHRHNRGNALYKALKGRYGSFQKALKHYGLPTFTCSGPIRSYKFPDGTTQIINIMDKEQRDMLFNLLITRCEIILKS